MLSLMKKAAQWLAPHYDSVALVLALIFGCVAAAIAWWAADGRASSDFYGVAAQTLPVFLVALAVEHRLLNRLGMSEEAYAREAQATFELGLQGRSAYENNDPTFIEFSRQLDARPKFKWVMDHVEEAYQGVPSEDQHYGPVDAAARRRFASIRRGQARWSGGVILLLTVGLVAAFTGLAADGSSTACAYFWLTAVATCATFLVIALTALREVVEDLAVA